MNDGGSAFPEICTEPSEWLTTGKPYGDTHSYGGMTLRDYFAAKAMQAALNPEVLKASSEAMDLRGDPFLSYVAMSAYKMADAMLKERTVSRESGNPPPPAEDVGGIQKKGI